MLSNFATLAEHINWLITANTGKTVHITGDGSYWCDEHVGARIMKILVNGEVIDSFCPYSYE
jgi:hypothetical protein